MKRLSIDDCGRATNQGDWMGYQEEYGALLEAIAQEADAIALKYFRSEAMQIERKKDGTAVTQADREVETMARAKVASSGILLDVLGEEMGGDGATAPRSSGRARMIIDPIDGTEEFSRGIPTFGTLMGIERDGEIVAGFVSAPALHTHWWAYRGEGAYRDGRRLHVSSVAQLSDAMIFTTGVGPSKNQEMRAKLVRLMGSGKHGRSLGGYWQHMLVAEGAVEVAIDLTSKPWDLAPLGIIVEEAGGRSTTLSGIRSIYKGELLSTNGKLHDEVLKLLQ
jgi:histidinol-phosphatase